jgi:preprotein translocase subunit SecF
MYCQQDIHEQLVLLVSVMQQTPTRPVLVCTFSTGVYVIKTSMHCFCCVVHRCLIAVCFACLSCCIEQGIAAGLVNTGQQLLATSRQLTPQLDQLAAMAATAKQLRQQADSLKQLGAAMQAQQQQQQQQQQEQEQQQQQQQQAQQQQHEKHAPAAAGPSGT